MALYGNTRLKDLLTFRMQMQPNSSGLICYRSRHGWIQKRRVGQPHRSLLRIGFCRPPCEGPQERLFGRRRGVRLRFAEVGMAKDHTVPSRQGGARHHAQILRAPAHGTLSFSRRLRRTASTAAIRCPSQRMTGTAIELPSALYRGPSAASFPRYSTSV